MFDESSGSWASVLLRYYWYYMSHNWYWMIFNPIFNPLFNFIQHPWLCSFLSNIINPAEPSRAEPARCQVPKPTPRRWLGNDAIGSFKTYDITIISLWLWSRYKTKLVSVKIEDPEKLWIPKSTRRPWISLNFWWFPRHSLGLGALNGSE